MNAPGSPPARILVVEDEAHLAEGLVFNLRAEGYFVQLAADGEAALELLGSAPVDAILLDVMLPGRDGFSVAAELRARQNYTPILMLTARGRPEDILSGFAAGADDYLAKPFDLSILLARLHGLLRRMAWLRPPAGAVDATRQNESLSSYAFAGRVIQFDSLQLVSGGKTVRLTLMESDLLRYLIANRGRVISRKEILEQVWRVREDTDTRAIDNFIVRLRRYLEDDPSKPVYLETVRGVGYRFVPQDSAKDAAQDSALNSPPDSPHDAKQEQQADQQPPEE